jgi:GTP pyrophosphokinase
MPLSTVLRNGDEVHILTSSSRTPPAAWERLAVTGKARSAIRRAARDSLRRQYAELGRRLISSAFAKIGEDYSDDKLRRALSRLTHMTVDDVCAAVGRSELPIADVIRAIAPEAAKLPPAPARAPAQSL